MAPDGPDDGNRDDRPERQLRLSRPDSDAAGSESRAELAEPRTRAEYYEAVRAAHSEAARADGNPAGEKAGRSGWDAIEARRRPDIDALRVTPERATHILDGDATGGGGGGDRHGTGKPGKTGFPASWGDAKILDAALDVARYPDSTPGHQEWNDRWVARGTREDVGIVAVIQRDGRIWSTWPLPGGCRSGQEPGGDVMDESEIARRASGLPGRFADRVPAATREILELMESGGEYGELTIEPAAGQVPVTAAERDELRALLEAMQMPSEPIGRLNVRG